MATTIDIENAKQIRAPMDVLIQVTPESGDPIIINNENLIDAVVSLRADLSIIDPTLPESEIEIHAYYDTDISDPLSKIPNETPLTYQAGYPGDMSPVRMFYIDDQITWENNVITIHAVDAVHFFDKKPMYPFTIGYQTRMPTGGENISGTAYRVWMCLLQVLKDFGIPETHETMDGDDWSVGGGSVVADKNAREFLASVMQLFHQTFPDDFFYESTGFFPTYVDAGIPRLRFKYPTVQYEIREEDCGNVKRNTERKITGIDAVYDEVDFPTREAYSNYGDAPTVGSATWIKGVGIYFSYEELALNMGLKYVTDAGQSYSRFIHFTEFGSFKTDCPAPHMGRGGNRLYTNDIPFGEFVADSYSDATGRIFTQFQAWNTPYASGMQNDEWSAIVTDGTVEQIDIPIYGTKVNLERVNKRFGPGDGYVWAMEEPIWSGVIKSGGDRNRQTINLFPDGAMRSILDRSNVTGSFVWKGDPRMQPRDVFNFIGLSYELATEDDNLITDENGNVLGGGSVTECTIESITLTHEGGGTTAEITYREGIC